MTRIPISALLTAVLALSAVVDAQAANAGGRSDPGSGARQVRAQRAAADRLAARDPATLATTLAERYWGAVPCGGAIAVRTDQPLAAGMDATTYAWVSFQSSLGPDDLQAPASTYSSCSISLAQWQWPTRALEAGDWNMFCLTVVHELGHLLGHSHSLVPGSVMAAVFTDEDSVPAICREQRLRVETSAGLAGAR